MPHKNKKLIRSIQKNIHKFQEMVKFKTSHISTGGKIVLFGIGITFISLFFPWISPLDAVISCGYSDTPESNSFSGLLGGTGFFILLILAVMSFSIFSIQKKEKLHFLSQLHLSDIHSAIFGSSLICVLTLHSYFIISGLQFFSVNILYGKGIILCITGSIVIFAGAYIMKREYRKNSKGSYLSELQNSKNTAIGEEGKNNMKFPF